MEILSPRHVPGVVVLIVLALAAGCATAPKSVPDAGAEVRVYEVFGMDCPGCHGGLEDLAEALPAVAAAAADWTERRLTLRLRPGAELNDGEVFAVIEKANFTPGERLQ